MYLIRLIDSLMAPVFVEYVWIGTGAGELRSKSRVLDFAPESISDVPGLALDGSIYGMDQDESGDVYLQPRSLFADPFRGGGHLLVLCDAFVTEITAPDSQTICLRPLGTREACADVMQKAEEIGANPSFGCEQEYFSGYWPHEHIPNPAESLVVPANHSDDTTALKLRSKSRRLAERHLRTCLQAGIEVVEVSEVNQPTNLANSNGSCWSYKISSSKGLHLADQLWMSRFLMIRLSDEEGVPVSFKPRTGHNHRAKCFVECSNEGTRDPCFGLSNIQIELQRLGACHKQHSMVYDDDSCNFVVNAPGDKRHSSVYVPKNTLAHKSGYYIDCRPPSDIDPYLAVMMLASSTLFIPLPTPSHLVRFQDPKHSLLSSQGISKKSHRSLSQSSLFVDGNDCGMNSESLLLDELNRMDSENSNMSRLEPYDDQDELMVLSYIKDEGEYVDFESDSASSCSSPMV